MTCRWHVRAAMTEQASSLRESIPVLNRQTAVFLFCPRESKGAVVNDVPVARQSRDDRAGVEPARIDSRIKPPNGGFSFLPEGIEESGSE